MPEHKLSYLIANDATRLSVWGQLSSIKAKVLRDHLEKPLPSIMSRDINYFHFKDCTRIKEGTPHGYSKNFTNIGEIDITAAYVSAAYAMRIITKDHFDKLIKGPKKERLKILGALGTQKRVEYWCGPDLINTDFKSNDITRNAWFNICKRVDDIISAVYREIGHAGIFYYVDNIYFYQSPELIKQIFAMFRDNNMKCKYYKLDNFFLYNARRGAVIVIKRTSERKVRTFFVPSPKIIKYEIIN